MQSDALTRNPVTRNLIRRSLTALGLLAGLAVGALALFWLQTRTIESSARVLNLSGRQRMLSQRTALLAESLAREPAGPEREALRHQLMRVSTTLEETHDGLLRGDPELGLPPAPTPSVETIYDDAPHHLDAKMQRYLALLREFTAMPEHEGERSAAVLRQILEAATGGELLDSLDAMVGAFQDHQERQITRLQNAKWIVFLLTLVVLVSTLRWVIWPMVEQVARDMRALQSREEAIREHHKRLAHVTRLSTMGEMAAGIAHEVNQPLSAIAIYAEASRRAIISGAVDSKTHLRTLEKICAQAHRAGAIIRRIRALSERRDSSQEICDLNDLVEDAVELGGTYARFHDLHIVCDLASDLPPVMVDAIQIQQVLLNLISNAMEAMALWQSPPETPARRDVLVSTRRWSADSDAERDDDEFGEGVEVSVRDHGPGLPADSEEQLFEPFFTTKQSGMGMGLSISRSIANSHGGKLGVRHNDDDAGSTFFLILPAVRDMGSDDSADAVRP